MRIAVNVASETSTATPKKSSRNPSSGQWPITGMAKSRSNSAP